MSSLFYHANATTYDISSFDISKVTDIDGMFDSGKLLTVRVKDQENAQLFHQKYPCFDLYVGDDKVYASSCAW